MSDNEKALTYEEAKQLCRMAFDGGVTYGDSSVRYSCNAVAYDWDHWLKRNERLFMPAPTVEDVLRDYASRILIAGCIDEEDELVAEYAAKLRLAGDEE